MTEKRVYCEAEGPGTTLGDLHIAISPHSSGPRAEGSQHNVRHTTSLTSPVHHTDNTNTVN